MTWVAGTAENFFGVWNGFVAHVFGGTEWGAQPDPRPWRGQSTGQSQQLVRPAARPARGHGWQALTTRPRGACPLTGRDRDVGRTNQTERSLKEVSGLKAVDPPHSPHFLRFSRDQLCSWISSYSFSTVTPVALEISLANKIAS